MRHAQLIYAVFFLSFLCLTVYEIVVMPSLFVEPEEGGACQNDNTDCGTKSCLDSKALAV